MFSAGFKYYLVTYFNVYYEVKFIKTQQYAAQKNITEYVFRTKKGDLHLIAEKSNPDKNNNFISTNFTDVKIELARRLYQNKKIARLPLPAEKLLQWGIENHPEKLL